MKFRSKEQIAKDYPFVIDRAKYLTGLFGGYAGIKLFANGELVYSWDKKETYVVPINTILNRDGTYKQLPKGTFWNTDAKATIKSWKP